MLGDYREHKENFKKITLKREKIYQSEIFCLPYFVMNLQNACLALPFLLVAHWLEHWGASLAAQVQFLACPVQRQLLQGGTQSCIPIIY